MSSIYLNEPSTNGKVCLKTTVGDVDVELWSRECPKACRNFLMLCASGYYDNTIFHRIERGFIIQGGDPTGTGCGGESAFGEPFKDEFHSRLRFTRRGLVAMANDGRNRNGSQFFFTLDKTPELQNKHTLFGKVTGPTLFNMLRLADSQTDDQHRPLYPEKILRCEVISNPFPDLDLAPKKPVQAEVEKAEKAAKREGKKCLKLLSFGDEAEEEEMVVTEVNKKLSSRGKSAHDILADEKKLSSEPTFSLEDLQRVRGDAEANMYLEEDAPKKNRSSAILERLKAMTDQAVQKKSGDGEESDEDLEHMLTEEELKKKRAKMEQVTSEYARLFKELRDAGKPVDNADQEKKPLKPAVAEYYASREKYVAKSSFARGTTERERETLKVLQNFQSKLKAANELMIGGKYDLEEAERPPKVEDWMAHKFVAPAPEPEVKGSRPQDKDMFQVEDLRSATSIDTRTAPQTEPL